MEDIIVIDYRGAIQYETIGELIHRFKDRAHSLGIQIGTYKRILLVLIEALENIMKHSENPVNQEPDDSAFASIVSVLRRENNFVVTSSNMIKSSMIPFLRERIDHLNGLDRQGIKDFYKETITNGVFTNTGGAGLGLIEIAKISGKRIEYAFLQPNDHYSRFNLLITIEENSTQRVSVKQHSPHA